MARPIIDLLRDDPGSYWVALREKYHGLPDPLEEHLNLAELQSLCGELYLQPLDSSSSHDDPQTWVRALSRTSNSTADCCFFSCVKPDTAATTTTAPCSYVELLQRQNALDDEGRPLVGPATYFVSHAWAYDFTTFLKALCEVSATRQNQSKAKRRRP